MQSSFKGRLEALNAQLTQRWSLTLSLLAVIVCMLGFQWLKTRLGAAMLDEVAGYDRLLLDEIMLGYGAAGRVLHLRFTLALDMVFPLAYGAFFGGLLVLAARGNFAPRYDATLLMPVIAVMVLDYSENVQLAFLLGQYPDLTEAQINAASATTQAKIWAIWFYLYWLAGMAVWKSARRFARTP